MFIQHNKVHFVPNLLSQMLILNKDIPDIPEHVRCFFMSDNVKIWYTKKRDHIYMSSFLWWNSVFS